MRFIGILDKVSPLNNMEIIMGFGFRSLFGRHQDNLKYHDRRNDDRIKLPKIATILIVDDSRTAIAVLRKTLEPTGYTILSALNAEEGIEIANEVQLINGGIESVEDVRKRRGLKGPAPERPDMFGIGVKGLNEPNEDKPDEEEVTEE